MNTVGPTVSKLHKKINKAIESNLLQQIPICNTIVVDLRVHYKFHVVSYLSYTCHTCTWLKTRAGVSFSFIWVAVAQYTANVVPPASLGTVQGLIHGFYFGLGSGIGQFVGGVLIDRFGAVLTFYIFAVLSAVSIGLFYVSQKVSVRSMKLNN